MFRVARNSRDVAYYNLLLPLWEHAEVLPARLYA